MRGDITGKKFNHLTAIKRTDNVIGVHDAIWIFRCDCGKTITARKSNVTIGTTKSCGCLKREQSVINAISTHRMTRTRFYRIFMGIKSRCYNSKMMDYKHYGGRGIKCLWNSFDEFKHDMYDSYLEHVYKQGVKNTSIDRIDNDGDYCRDNCRWATESQQKRNRTINHNLTFNGETRCLKEWSELTGIKFSTLQTRLTLGWSAYETLNIPPKKYNK